MELGRLTKETLISIIHEQSRVINGYEREHGIPLTSPRTPKALPKPVSTSPHMIPPTLSLSNPETTTTKIIQGYY
jgi:hypothetical protein